MICKHELSAEDYDSHVKGHETPDVKEEELKQLENIIFISILENYIQELGDVNLDDSNEAPLNTDIEAEEKFPCK